MRGEKMNVIQRAVFKIFNKSINDYAQSFLNGDPVRNANIVDKETAMKYTAVFAACRVIGETFASAPVGVYKKLPNGDRESATDLPIYDILHNRPNADMAPFNFKEANMYALNLDGNAYCYKEKNKLGELVGLMPIAGMVKSVKRKNGVLTYTVENGTEEKDYTRDDIFHIPGLSMDGLKGLSPISYFGKTIKLGLTYEEFGNSFYKNSANPSGAFTFPNALGIEAHKRLKADIKKNYTGSVNLGTPMLLENGGTFVPFTIKPVDAQLIESKRFQIEDIARIYRVPLHLLQDLEKATFSNIEHQSLEFIMYTMLPWFKRWEENINMQLLTDRERKDGYYVEFNIKGLSRGDLKSRYESYVMGRLNGWLSINDVRKLENMNRVEGGDTYMQPLNYININKADGYYDKTQEVIANILKGSD